MLTKSEEAVVLMLDSARDARRRWIEADRAAVQARDAYAARCFALHETGLSLAQIAIGLGISRVEAQRLVQRGRESSRSD
jgi:DNA-directed RNA polymerase specialized sigma24 family protein